MSVFMRAVTLNMFLTTLLCAGFANAGSGDLAGRVAEAQRLVDVYRKASDQVLNNSTQKNIPYCVFRQWNAGRQDPNNIRVTQGMVSGARNGVAWLSGRDALEEIYLAEQDALNKREVVSVSGIAMGFFTGLIPLDNDTYRVLYATHEYDRQNRLKFELFADGLKKISQDLTNDPAGRMDRLGGQFGFAGLTQTVGYVSRDYVKEFNGKKMLNTGKCGGAADAVLEVGSGLRVERETLDQLVSVLNNN
jgi:hypothetical protein